MASDDNITAEAFSRAIGTLFDLRQAGVDWATVVHAVLAFREEERQRWHDAHDELSERPSASMVELEEVNRTATAGNDAAALYIKMHATLLSSLLRMGRDWQRLLLKSALPLKDAADAYQAEPDPAPQVREALINQLVIFSQALGEFARDQGARLEREIERLRFDILARHEAGKPTARFVNKSPD
jgi:hypothetical protein